MKNKLSNNKLNDLLTNWIIFSNEELARLKKKIKKHLLHFDKLEDKLLKSSSYKNREFAKKIL